MSYQRTLGNGTSALNPADVGYDLILVAGQSNAVGNDTTVDPKLDVTDQRIWQYGNSGSYANVISLAADPLAHHSIVGVGPGMTFARRYLQSIPLNRKVLLVPVAHGGTPFEGLTSSGADINWRVGGSGISLYANALTQVTGALAAAGTNARLTAILWIQGEQDVGNGTSVATYRTDLDALIDGWRADMPGAATVPFVVGQMLPEVVTANPSTYGVIDAVHVDTIRRKTRTGFAYGVTGFQQASSPVHYTAAGQRLQGLNLYSAYQRALVNVTGAPPTVPTGLTVSQSGTTVNATWSLPAGRVTNFDVQSSSDSGTTWTTATRTSPNPAATQPITGLTLGSSYQVRVRATNEDGTSSYCTPVPITLATLPAQVTGLSITPAGSGFTAGWSAATGATSYLVEYKAHASGTWLTWGTVTGLAAVLTGLTNSTSYDVRVTGQNAAGSGTASTTATNTTLSVTTLSVTSTIPGQAYSAARRIVSTYTGPALRLYHSVSGTTLDVGFDGSGNLDTSGIAAFLGSADGLVATLYDQSGSGRDLTQATPANMPRLAVAGVVQTAGGKPTISFDGVTQHLFRNQGSFLSSGLYFAGAMTLTGVMLAASQVSKVVLGEGQSGGANGAYQVASSAAANGYLTRFIRGNGGTISLASDAGAVPALFTGAIHQFSVVDAGTSWTRFVDATQEATETYTRAQDPLTDRFAVGGNYKSGAISGNFAGSVSELCFWYSALGSTDRATAQTDQKSYYGTP